MEKEFSIEEIMEEIRKEIKEKGLTSDMLSFSDVARVSAEEEEEFSEKELEVCLANLGASYVISESRPLEGNSFVVFVKRIIRKLTRFYIKPVADAQTEFNACAVRIANMLSLYVRDGHSEGLEKRIRELELKLEAAVNENRALLSRIEALETRAEDAERR